MPVSARNINTVWIEEVATFVGTCTLLLVRCCELSFATLQVEAALETIKDSDD